MIVLSNNKSKSNVEAAAKGTSSPQSEKPKKDISPLLEWLPLTCALIYYLSNICIISPFGNFPLNDDYVYGLAVKHLIETGNLQLYASGSACYLHVLIGAAVSSIFGFSFEALRMSNLFMGMMGLLGVFLIAREANVSRTLAGLAACLYAVNPLTTNLQFTFMTDISASTFFCFYLLFLLKGIKKNNSVTYCSLAGVFLIASILVRQNYVIYAVANVIALVFLSLNKRFSLTILTMLVILPIASMIASDKLMESTSEMVYAYNYHKSALISCLSFSLIAPFVFAKVFLIRSSIVLAYLGLFAIPVLISALNPIKTKRLFNTIGFSHMLVAVPVIAFLLLYFSYGTKIPCLSNLWRTNQLGANGLIGQNVSWSVNAITEPITLIAFLGLLVLVSIFVITSRKLLEKIKTGTFSKETATQAICFLVMAVSLAFTTINTTLRPYDRYLIDALIPTFICIAIACSNLKIKPLLIPALILLTIQGCITTVEQQYYMAWNRARWQAVSWLESTGIKSSHIDGGAEYNFLRDINLWNKYTIEPGKHELDDKHKGSKFAKGLRWWPVSSSDTYIISFINIDGYKEIKSFPIKAINSSKHAQMKVLEKIGNQSKSSAEKVGGASN